MTEVLITIEDREVRQMLNSAPRQFDRAMRGGMTDSTVYVLNQMQTYPPQRPGSEYVRTGNLRRSWSRQVRGRGQDIRGIVGSNSNVAPYNRRVQDAERQASVHRGRWTNTAQRVAERSRSTIQGFFNARLLREVGR